MRSYFVILSIILIPFQLFSQSVFENGMVVSAHPLASEIGVQILKKGGNAIDAAIATEFALAVCFPVAGNIGGGGFWTVYTQNQKAYFLNYREKAPLTAHKSMYLDSAGNVIQAASTQGRLAVGVPGTVAGMHLAHKKWGKLPWKAIIAPSILLAKRGFVLTKREADSLNGFYDAFLSCNPNGCYLVKQNRNFWKEGDTLVNKALANALYSIATKGAKAFYRKSIAKAIVQEMIAHQPTGIINEKDLYHYRATITPVEKLKYGNYDILLPDLPSAARVLIPQMLYWISKYPIHNWGPNNDSTIQLIVEAERRAYADRAYYLGDPKFIKVPIDQLTDTVYLNERWKDFEWTRAGLSKDINHGILKESTETTHYTVMDKSGNAVSATTTLNGAYGSKVVVAKCGFLLNNQMDDFAIKPGFPNSYQLIGSMANSIAPQKQMLSSMSPIILLKNDKAILTIGSPGGSTITTSVLQTLLNIVAFNMTPQQAVSFPRFHHQWLPDEIRVELNRLSISTEDKLKNKGYFIRKTQPWGRVEVIMRNDSGLFEGGADPRGLDHVAGW